MSRASIVDVNSVQTTARTSGAIGVLIEQLRFAVHCANSHAPSVAYRCMTTTCVRWRHSAASFRGIRSSIWTSLSCRSRFGNRYNHSWKTYRACAVTPTHLIKWRTHVVRTRPLTWSMTQFVSSPTASAEEARHHEFAKILQRLSGRLIERWVQCVHERKWEIC